LLAAPIVAALMCLLWSGVARGDALSDGHAALEAGDWKTAQKAFKKAAKSSKNSVESLWGLGLVQIRKGDFHAAKKHCRQFTKKKPDSPWSHTCLGYAFLVWKKWGQAQQSFDKALAIDSGFALAIAGQAHALVIAVKYSQAIEKYKEALGKDPDNIEALLGLADVYVNKNKNDKAVELLEKAVAAHPGSSRAHLALARAQGKGTDAISHALKALDIRPEWDEGYLVLGEVYFASGKYVKAIGALEKAVELEPGFVQAEKLIGMSYYEQGKYEEAITKLGEVLVKVPNLADAALAVAMSHDALNAYEDAVESYKTAINLDSKNPMPVMKLADLYYRMNKSTSALSTLGKAVKLRSNMSEAHKLMGDIYFENKQYKMASQSYKKALDGDKKNIDTGFVNQRLKQLKSMGK
jgi:tetratricopeptide (TPR) repeat protein